MLVEAHGMQMMDDQARKNAWETWRKDAKSQGAAWLKVCDDCGDCADGFQAGWAAHEAAIVRVNPIAAMHIATGDQIEVRDGFAYAVNYNKH